MKKIKEVSIQIGAILLILAVLAYAAYWLDRAFNKEEVLPVIEDVNTEVVEVIEAPVVEVIEVESTEGEFNSSFMETDKG